VLLKLRAGAKLRIVPICCTLTTIDTTSRNEPARPLRARIGSASAVRHHAQSRSKSSAGRLGAALLEPASCCGRCRTPYRAPATLSLKPAVDTTVERVGDRTAACAPQATTDAGVFS
jgi:hypothetical protein